MTAELTEPTGLFDTAMALVTAASVAYLLYSDRFAVAYRRFFRVLLFGMVTVAVTAPLASVLVPTAEHAVHALGAAFLCAGLYGIVDRRLETGRSVDAFR